MELRSSQMEEEEKYIPEKAGESSHSEQCQILMKGQDRRYFWLLKLLGRGRWCCATTAAKHLTMDRIVHHNVKMSEVPRLRKG